jgi:hypothetical protein
MTSASQSCTVLYSLSSFFPVIFSFTLRLDGRLVI